MPLTCFGNIHTPIDKHISLVTIPTMLNQYRFSARQNENQMIKTSDIYYTVTPNAYKDGDYQTERAEIAQKSKPCIES